MTVLFIPTKWRHNTTTVDMVVIMTCTVYCLGKPPAFDCKSSRYGCCPGDTDMPALGPDSAGCPGNTCHSFSPFGWKCVENHDFFLSIRVYS